MGGEFLALAVIVLLFSVVVHEVMHGLIALKFGDHTAERAGRLTLNPIPHIDPIGTILMPLIFLLLPALTGVTPGFFIGWAKPVPINPLNFKDIRVGELMVSLAGVASNFGLALIGTIIYHLGNIFLSNNLLILDISRFMVSINLMLGVFNLLPIPPLDGSKVLPTFLSYKLAREYEKLSPYGLLILLALLYLNVISIILALTVYPLHALLQIPPL